MSHPVKLAALAALLASSAAQAACTASATAVAFGAYNPRSATADTGNGSVRVTCSPSAAYSIAIGTGGGGSFTGRRMVSGAFTLPYQLFTNSARTTVWGNGSSGTSVRSFNNTGTTATVYGRIPALQNVGAGTYSDSVVVTVTF